MVENLSKTQPADHHRDHCNDPGSPRAVSESASSKRAVNGTFPGDLPIRR